jgi:hypothetical protein
MTANSVLAHHRAHRTPFMRLRRALLAHQIASLQFVYYAFAGLRFVTLCATPIDASGGRIELPERMRTRLLRAFLRWMSLRQPDWTDGPDAAGLLRWELRRNGFAHRHYGHTQQFFRRSSEE